MIDKFKPQPEVREADAKCRLSLNIVYIDELKPDPANPRRHTKQQIRNIADSIRAFGFNVPVLIDREKNVGAGHGRVLACGELGWSEVPNALPRSPHPGAGPGLQDCRQSLDRDLRVGRPLALTREPGSVVPVLLAFACERRVAFNDR
jgi:hypothetical protein